MMVKDCGTAFSQEKSVYNFVGQKPPRPEQLLNQVVYDGDLLLSAVDKIKNEADEVVINTSSACVEKDGKIIFVTAKEDWSFRELLFNFILNYIECFTDIGGKK